MQLHCYKIVCQHIFRLIAVEKRIPAVPLEQPYLCVCVGVCVCVCVGVEGDVQVLDRVLSFSHSLCTGYFPSLMWSRCAGVLRSQRYITILKARD